MTRRRSRGGRARAFRRSSFARVLPSRGLRASLLGVLKALAVCLALQLSGLVHFAVDLWLEGDAAAHHFSAPDDGDHDCPPGCVSCHCAHGTSALPAPLEGAVTLLPAYELVWAPYPTGTPPSLTPLPVFRPPRA